MYKVTTHIEQSLKIVNPTGSMMFIYVGSIGIFPPNVKRF